MAPNALHIWPRGGFMMIALPNIDRSFTCTLFLAHRGDSDERPGFDRIVDAGDAAGAGILRFFERWFPDAAPLMPTLVDDFRRNPVGSMVTVRCRPWHRGRIALLGDAAHAIVPFYGQGANCAFEDCVAMAEALRRHRADVPAALEAYEQARVENANAIADLALRNFIEMRDHTGSRLFRVKKKIERTLQTLFPSRYTPLYTMVSFTRTPYADARRRSEAQNRVLVVAALTLLTVLIAILKKLTLGGPWLQALFFGVAAAALLWLLAARKLRNIQEAAVADGARR